MTKKHSVAILILALSLTSCSSGNDITCPVGEHLNSSSLICIPDCDTGKVYSGGQCLLCTAGQIANLDQTKCSNCQAGTYNNAAGATTCIPCTAGQYSEAGAIVCLQCPIGTYNELAGSATCKACTGNTFNNMIGAIACTPCPGGTTANSDHTACN